MLASSARPSRADCTQRATPTSSPPVASKDHPIHHRDASERLWVLEPLPAWAPTNSHLSRLTQAPKHQLADPALAARLVIERDEHCVAAIEVKLSEAVDDRDVGPGTSSGSSRFARSNICYVLIGFYELPYYADRMATAIVDPAIEQTDSSDFDAVLNEVAGHLNAQHARLIDLTITMLADESLWVGDGAHSPELFLAWRTGLAANRARQIVTIARRADELPETIEACRRGELAIDQMAAIANRAPWWADHEICDLAKKLTVGQLRHTLSTYPFPQIPSPTDAGNDENVGADADGGATDPADVATTSPDSATDPDCTQDPDCAAGSADRTDDAGEPTPVGGASGEGSATSGRIWWAIGDDGQFHLHLDCDPLTAMTIEAAMREARDSLIQDGHRNVSDLDAFLEMAQRSLDGVESPSRRERFRTNIFIRTDGTCCDDHASTIPDAIRQYITCDGLMSPVFVTDDIPISVGRTQRMIPLRTRRIVVLRDQGCRVPSCNVTHHIEVHHIIHWEDDGTTDTWNLIALCPKHHRMHHRGELGIVGNADIDGGVTFTNRHGRVIGTTGARPQPPGALPPAPTGVYEHPLGERLDSHWLYFNPPAEHRKRAWDEHPHNPLRAS